MFKILVLQSLCDTADLFTAPYEKVAMVMEHIGNELREKGFHNRVFSSLNVLEEHLLGELRKLENNSDVTKSIVAWPWSINTFMI